MRRKRTKLFAFSAFAIIFLIFFLGVPDHLYEMSYESTFNYPLAVNIMPLARQIISGVMPDVKPINKYNYTYLSTCENKCKNTQPLLVILVKSAIPHFDRRAAIRQTWGSENEHEAVIIKSFFILGIKERYDKDLQKKINQELKEHNDIIQCDFIDTYYNNTIKTMMAFRWAFEYCPRSKFYLFSDDDMFISVKNALKFLGISASYFKDANGAEKQEDVFELKNEIKRNARDALDIPNANFSNFMQSLYRDKYLAYEQNLYAGFVFKSSPQRHLTSKWHISLEEYPWDTFPPYVTAGAYVLSNEALKLMYAGSMYVKHFKFDDVYLGIVALKLGIEPLHCEHFYFYKKLYSLESYKDVIAAHGYDDPKELLKVWTDLRNYV